MKNQDWKLKYEDLKLKFMDAVDVSFRLGFEQGAQQVQLQQAQAALQPQPGMPGQEQPGEQSGDSGQLEQQPDGSELDQHIATLESMVGQAQPNSPEQQQMQKSLDGIKAFQHSLKQASELRKSEKAIAGIAKSLKAPFTLSKAATKNLSPNGKKALSMQEQIVEDLMKSMEEEEKKVAESINKTLSLEQLLKD